MEIKVIEKTKTKLIFKIEGAGHTLCNILKNALKENKNVKTVSYRIEHPLIGIPKMQIETNASETPEAAIKKALKNISSDADKLKKSVDKELK